MSEKIERGVKSCVNDPWSKGWASCGAITPPQDGISIRANPSKYPENLLSLGLGFSTLNFCQSPDCKAVAYTVKKAAEPCCILEVRQKKNSKKKLNKKKTS